MFAAIVLLLLASCISAGTYTFTGASTTNLWDDVMNWSPFGLPSSGDDCVVPLTARPVVLVSTGNGMKCRNAQISAGVTVEVRGANAVTDKMESSGTLLLNMGAGMLNVSSLTLLDGAVVNWVSGSWNGDVMIGPKASVSAIHPNGEVSKRSGKWVNKGLINITNVTFDAYTAADSTVKNDGIIDIHAATISGFSTSADSTGTVLLHENYASRSVMLYNAIVTSSNARYSSFVASTFNSGTFDSCSVNSSTVLGGSFTQGGSFNFVKVPELHTFQLNSYIVSMFNVNSVDCAGTLSAYNPGYLQFGGNSHVANFVYSGNRLGFQGTTNIDNATIAGTVIISNGVTAIKTAIFNGLDLYGTSPLAVQSAKFLWQFFIRPGAALSVQNAMFDSNGRLTFDGTLDIGGSAVITHTGLGQTVMTTTTGNGTINNNGRIEFISNNVTIERVHFTGAGTVVVTSSILDLENFSATFATLQLSKPNSAIRGNVAALSYGALLGPAPGSTLRIIINGVMTTCTSPCPSYAAPSAAQTLFIYVSE